MYGLAFGLAIAVYFAYLDVVGCSKVAIYPPFKVTGAKFMATIIIQENDTAVLDVLTQALILDDHRPIPILGPCPKVMSSAVKRHRPDLVLMEYRANVRSWSELLSSIRNISSFLPVIALSCDLNIAKLAGKLGFDGFLAKPFDLGELCDTVNAFLSSSPDPQLSTGN